MNKIENIIINFLLACKERLKISSLLCLVIGILVASIGIGLMANLLQEKKITVNTYWICNCPIILVSAFFLSLAKVETFKKD